MENDHFNRLLGMLHGLPEVVSTKPSPIQTVTIMTGNAEFYSVQTYRQKDLGDTIFLQCVRDGETIRMALPPAVANAIAFCTSAGDVTVTTAAGVIPLKLVLKTCLAVANCGPLFGCVTCPPMAWERPSQPDAIGSPPARPDPKTTPAASAPAAPRRNV